MGEGKFHWIHRRSYIDPSDTNTPGPGYYFSEFSEQEFRVLHRFIRPRNLLELTAGTGPCGLMAFDIGDSLKPYSIFLCYLELSLYFSLGCPDAVLLATRPLLPQTPKTEVSVHTSGYSWGAPPGRAIRSATLWCPLCYGVSSTESLLVK